MRLKFLKPLLILTGILAVLLAWPLSTWLVETRSAVFAAGAVAFCNTLLGLIIIELTIDKSNVVFMAAFFGGMGIRVFLVLFAFALLVSMGFHAMTLTFFLMGLYFAYLSIEIYYLVQEISRYKQKNGKYRVLM